MSWKVLFFLVSVVLLSLLFKVTRRFEIRIGSKRNLDQPLSYWVDRSEIIAGQFLSLLALILIWVIQFFILVKWGGEVDKTITFLVYISPSIYLAVWTYLCTDKALETDMRRIMSYVGIALIASSSYFDQIGEWMIHRLQGTPPTGSEQWYASMIATLFLALDRILKLIQDDKRKFENENTAIDKIVLLETAVAQEDE